MAGRPLYIVSWSGGKDSTATVVLAHEHGISLDKIVISLPWFSKEKKIYADHPDHVEWVLGYAKPLFEKWGYPVEILSSDKDYIYWFNKIRSNKCKNAEYVGKRYGWIIAGMCKMNPEKVEPINKYVRSLNSPFIMYEGIAADEERRLMGMHLKRGHYSLLESYKISEFETYAICRKYGLLSPLYNRGRKRQGCWFCPNQSIAELADTKENHPELWAELRLLSKIPNTATHGFKYGKTFEEVEVLVDDYIKNRPPEQLTFDFI